METTSIQETTTKSQKQLFRHWRGAHQCLGLQSQNWRPSWIFQLPNVASNRFKRIKSASFHVRWKGNCLWPRNTKQLVWSGPACAKINSRKSTVQYHMSGCPENRGGKGAGWFIAANVQNLQWLSRRSTVKLIAVEIKSYKIHNLQCAKCL